MVSLSSANNIKNSEVFLPFISGAETAGIGLGCRGRDMSTLGEQAWIFPVFILRSSCRSFFDRYHQPSHYFYDRGAE